MKNNKLFIAVIVLVIIGAIAVAAMGSNPTAKWPGTSNAPNSAENAPEGSIHNLPVPGGVSAARSALAMNLNISASEILIVEAIEVEWPNSCLGVSDPEEFCAQVITPGYEVLMQAGGQMYRYRTDLSGSIVKSVKE